MELVGARGTPRVVGVRGTPRVRSVREGSTGRPTLARCLLADRSAVWTEGLRAILSASGKAVVVGSTAEPDEVPDLVDELAPDVVLASFEPPASAVAVARAAAGVPVLVLTWSRREDDLIDALRAGAAGFLHKDIEPDDLSRAIGDVAAGRSAFPTGWERLLVARLDGSGATGLRRADPVNLTSRERAIVQLIVDGGSNKALAASLGIAHQTAKNHVRHVMAKVRVNSRVQLCAWALERGYAPTGRAATA